MLFTWPIMTPSVVTTERPVRSLENILISLPSNVLLESLNNLSYELWHLYAA